MTLTPGLERLSPRQREVLGLVAKGLTNDDVAGALGISPATVRTHVTAILELLEVSNRTEATAVFMAADQRVDATPTRIDAFLRVPAIAVLPLVALDDGERARSMAAGMTADLSALLAASCWFPVISQASASNARALGATSQEIGRALGARFLIDGTLRVAGPLWRLTLTVDDAESGHSIWNLRQDFVPDALFRVQDELIVLAVAGVYPLMAARWQHGQRRVPAPRDLGAWELAHAGLELVALRDASSADTARALFLRALSLDAGLVLVHFGLGLVAYDACLNQRGDVAAARAELAERADRCIVLAPQAGEGYYLLGRYHQTCGDYARAVTALEGAVARNPSFASAHALLAQALHFVGRSDEGLARMRHAERLGPRAFAAGLATLHFARGEYALALDAVERCIAVTPRYIYARALAAACSWWAGDPARAHEHMARLRGDHPAFAPDLFSRTFGIEADPVRRLSEALIALSG